MPIYDFLCPACNGEHEELFNFEEYEAFNWVLCQICSYKMTKKDRVIGKGLTTTVIGVSKGNYGSGYFG